jgi:hypothetical protein
MSNNKYVAYDLHQATIPAAVLNVGAEGVRHLASLAQQAE